MKSWELGASSREPAPAKLPILLEVCKTEAKSHQRESGVPPAPQSSSELSDSFLPDIGLAGMRGWSLPVSPLGVGGWSIPLFCTSNQVTTDFIYIYFLFF